MALSLKETLDGSHTIYNSELSDHYHSTNGAIGESMHIYIKSGLLSFNSTSLSVFEVGFGTGLNALLTAIESISKGLRVKYTSIEKYPLNADLISALNYCEILKGDSTELYGKIIDAQWGTEVKINSHFTLKKIADDYITYKPEGTYDIIYYDAFGPDKQTDIWGDEILIKSLKLLKTDGVFVSYSVTGKLKRLLKSSGFEVELLPGPPGKREITRAVNKGL